MRCWRINIRFRPVQSHISLRSPAYTSTVSLIKLQTRAQHLLASAVEVCITAHAAAAVAAALNQALDHVERDGVIGYGIGA
jgi:hypothetical protein